MTDRTEYGLTLKENLNWQTKFYFTKFWLVIPALTLLMLKSLGEFLLNNDLN